MVQLLPWTLLFYGASGVVLITAALPLWWSLTANAVTLFLTVPLYVCDDFDLPAAGIFAFKIGKLGPLASSGWKWPGNAARSKRPARGPRMKPPNLFSGSNE